MNDTVEVLFERHYPGYYYRREIVDTSLYVSGGRELEMVRTYSDYGDCSWIGDAYTARAICKNRGIRQVQKANPVCSIGYAPHLKAWFGWSHRVIFGFSIGDKMFSSYYGNENTPCGKHGTITIKYPCQAKESAKRFARYIS